MKETLESLLSEINVRVINPVWDSIKQKEIVAWHCAMPNLIGYEKNIDRIINWIMENNSTYSITECSSGKSFFIYLNEK